MSYNIIIFDLDNTLIQTEDIKLAIFAHLKKIGLEDKVIKHCYGKAKENEEGENTFTLNHFAGELQRETGLAIDMPMEMFTHEHMQVAGAKAALAACTESGKPTYILTLGVPEWQKEKLGLVGLDAFVRDAGVQLLITTDVRDGKAKQIEELVKEHGCDEGDGMLLVNDKPDETERLLEIFPKLHAYVRREKDDARYSEAQFAKLSDHERVAGVSETLEALLPIILSS